LLAVSFPFVVLLLAEIAFRVIPGLNEDRDPFVNISTVSIFSRTTIAGKEYYNQDLTNFGAEGKSQNQPTPVRGQEPILEISA